jgi:hypothetical protein
MIVCFLSYTWHAWQKEFADALAIELRRQPGFEVWRDIERLRPGLPLYEQLQDGLGVESDCAVCLLSHEYFKSDTCKKELHFAQANAFKFGKPFFPVKIGECDLPLEVADLLYHDLSRAVSASGSIDRALLAEGAAKLAHEIRRSIEARLTGFADDHELSELLLHFFRPDRRTPVRLVSNRSYKSPFYEKSFSTTTRFTDAVAGVLRTLQARAVIADWAPRQSDYLELSDIDRLADGSDSLISYASSKINPLTGALLKRLETAYGITLRFILQDDLSKGVAESTFPDFDPARRLSLVVQDTRLDYRNCEDYGLLVRAAASPNGKKTWWIVAGCGRPGASAIYRMLFDPSWRTVLWPRISSKLPDAFYAIVRVRFDTSSSHAPTDPELIDFRILG